MAPGRGLGPPEADGHRREGRGRAGAHTAGFPGPPATDAVLLIGGKAEEEPSSDRQGLGLSGDLLSQGPRCNSGWPSWRCCRRLLDFGGQFRMVPREALRGGYSIAWRECFKRNSPLDVSAGPLPRTQAHARPSDDTHYHTLAAHPTNANANTYATTNANTYATTNANANTYTTTNATTNATAAGSSGATGMAVETASIKQVGSRREFLLGCTDVGALVCFVLTWVLALALARRAFVDGEPDRLTRGSDHLGRVCGVDDGVVEFPLLYWPARSQPPLPLRQELQSAHVVPVCTSRCPPSFTNGTHPRPVGSCAPDDTARGLCTW
eukprot:GHVT01024954.1.p1 GENE.GHVT01024954.1~~GHVT01024954.1.p1  ORF type:complete len:324 (+),score=63.14 GHVT01024954.1:452-1423(+)